MIMVSCVGTCFLYLIDIIHYMLVVPNVFRIFISYVIDCNFRLSFIGVDIICINVTGIRRIFLMTVRCRLIYNYIIFFFCIIFHWAWAFFLNLIIFCLSISIDRGRSISISFFRFLLFWLMTFFTYISIELN